jgi:ABC-type uncharacterized transport system substrate-binding protein
VRRREFIAALGGAAAWPLGVWAQPADRVPRVGVLISPAENDPEAQARVAAFRQSLQKLGWTEGSNIRVDYRWGGGDSERIKRYAAELVGLAPNVIIANGTPAVAALQQATRVVPIVFAQVMDPVGLGYIESFARPGGNITGFTFIDLSVIGKWLDMLKAMAPGTNRAALVYNPAVTPYYEAYLRSSEAASASQTVRLAGTPVSTPAELETAITDFARDPGGSLILPPDPFNVVHLERTAGLAQRLRLPTVSVYRKFADAGGLMSYGPDTTDIFRRAAAYVDRIIKGERPHDLPAQTPDKFEVVINLKTARALGLDVPDTILAVADEVIE